MATLKIVFYSCIAAIFLMTCDDDYEEPVGVYEEWTLVKMTYPALNQVATGNAMDWQEVYTFFSDGTFEKIRVRDSEEIIALGTFQLSEFTGEKLIRLQFRSGRSIVNGCEGERQETLRKTSEITLRGTWESCDGPILEYRLTRG